MGFFGAAFWRDALDRMLVSGVLAGGDTVLARYRGHLAVCQRGDGRQDQACTDALRRARGVRGRVRPVAARLQLVWHINVMPLAVSIAPEGTSQRPMMAVGLPLLLRADGLPAVVWLTVRWLRRFTGRLHNGNGSGILGRLLERWQDKTAQGARRSGRCWHWGI